MVAAHEPLSTLGALEPFLTGMSSAMSLSSHEERKEEDKNKNLYNNDKYWTKWEGLSIFIEIPQFLEIIWWKTTNIINIMMGIAYLQFVRSREAFTTVIPSTDERSVTGMPTKMCP